MPTLGNPDDLAQNPPYIGRGDLGQQGATQLRLVAREWIGVRGSAAAGIAYRKAAAGISPVSLRFSTVQNGGQFTRHDPSLLSRA
jgi:hypothetical protein